MSDPGFFKFIFNEETKTKMLNIGQFAFIVFLPLVLLVKLINILPEASETKGFLETLFEIILHVLILVGGIIIIVQFGLYFKTMSGVPYPEFTLYPVIIAVLLTAISFQTKISDKVFMLQEKVFSKMQPEKPKEAPAQSYSLTRQLQQPSIQPQQPQEKVYPTQQLPDYNQMYQQKPITLEQTTESFAPLAANEVGLNGFGSSF